MCIVGIVARKSKSEEDHDTNIIYTNIANSIYKNGGIPIGIILNENYKEVIDFCDGIIFQGGDTIEQYDLEALKYIYDKDKPVLGICLGMQLMGLLFDGELKKTINHKKKLDYAHVVYIDRNSKLHDIYNLDFLKVNSRHNDALKCTNLNISALSSDNVIEAVEDENKSFFIGIQWHPEDMIYDDNENKIFKYFIDILKNE